VAARATARRAIRNLRSIDYTFAKPYPREGDGRDRKDDEMKKLFLGLVAGSLFASQLLAADAGMLRADHPDEYVVQRGDTLWDISGRFLNKPWQWPEIWHANPQIANPHLIYPGDRLTLVYVDGEPRIVLNRASGGVVTLSPQVRTSALDDAIPAIPLEEINAFLSRSRIVAGGELEAAPYVIAGGNGHVVTGAGDQLYARGNFPPDEKNFGVFRAGQVFADPQTGEILGLEAVEIGGGRLVAEEGGLGTLSIERSGKEIRIEDRLLPAVEQTITATFYPSAPETEVNGVILAVEGGVSNVGRLDVVILNRGAREGLKEGNVLAIKKVGELARDPVTKETVQLPATPAGELMVFRVFEKLSYGLVLNATNPIKVMDLVANP
jgi:LysM domain